MLLYNQDGVRAEKIGESLVLTIDGQQITLTSGQALKLQHAILGGFHPLVECDETYVGGREANHPKRLAAYKELIA